MKIKLDHEKSQKISELLHTLDPLPRNELHLTDALYCPMKAYCRIVLDLLPRYTRRTAGVFITGIMFDRLIDEAFKSTKRSLKLGYSLGTPDVIEGMNPIEAKHTRLHIRSVKDIPFKWIEQLKLECVYCRVFRGWLLIGEIDTGLITAWELTISRKEYDSLRSSHINYVANLNYIFVNKILEEVPIYKEECSSCFYNYENGCPRRPK